MKNLIKLICFLPKKYIYFSLSIIIIALLMSISEVFVLASIKPFIQSFSLENVSNFNFNEQTNLRITLYEARKFLITVFVCGILRIFLIFAQYKIAAAVSAKISSEAFKRIINQDYIYLKSANQSKFLSILIQDIPRTSEAISNFASFCSNIIILCCISLSLLFLEPKLFIFSGILLSFVYLVILFCFAKRLKLNGNNISEFNHKEASIVRSTLASIVDFIVGGSLDKQTNIFRLNEIKLRNSYANTLIYAQSPRYIIETVCLALFTFFIIVSISSDTSLLIFAQLGTLLFAYNRVLPASQQTYAAYAFIKASSKSIENLISVFHLKSIRISKKSIVKNQINIKNDFFENSNFNKITIHNLNFEYENNKKIIYRDCQFEEGRPTAIVGKSGSGKTTLIELILRLLVPSKGQIKLNNININKLNPNSYYSNISYLSQSPFLFSGSIYENIMFGSNNEMSYEELYENGIKLGLEQEFGENFLDYKISDFGRNISGGQAQRCSLLKILSNIKPILILDEPSSALDKNTSMIFNELLLSKSKKSILIVITHSQFLSDLFTSKIDLSI